VSKAQPRPRRDHVQGATAIRHSVIAFHLRQACGSARFLSTELWMFDQQKCGRRTCADVLAHR
jgi:hypothetical protein